MGAVFGEKGLWSKNDQRSCICAEQLSHVCGKTGMAVMRFPAAAGGYSAGTKPGGIPKTAECRQGHGQGAGVPADQDHRRGGSADAGAFSDHSRGRTGRDCSAVLS